MPLILPPGAKIKHNSHKSTAQAQSECFIQDATGPAVFAARNFFSPQECQAWMDFADKAGFELQKHKATKYVAYRENGRLQLHSEDIAALIFQRLLPFIPAEVNHRRASGCNPNLRLYRYSQGQRFGPHVDESNRLEDGSITAFTVLLYLNGADKGLEGGETIFYDGKSVFRFAPQTGAALVHAHGSRCLTHEGAAVLQGAKYVLRTDVAFK